MKEKILSLTTRGTDKKILINFRNILKVSTQNIGCIILISAGISEYVSETLEEIEVMLSE